MTKIRGMASYLKPNLAWIMGAAFLLPWAEGTGVPLSPRTGEAS